jgi:hypothetical protein
MLKTVISWTHNIYDICLVLLFHEHAAKEAGAGRQGARKAAAVTYTGMTLQV